MLEIKKLTKNFAIKYTEEILSLEKNWREIGDVPWRVDNLLMELELKWELSHVSIYNKKIAGYQIGSLKEGSAFLNKIVVDKEARNLSIGKKLLKKFLESCLQKNLDNLRFRVRTDNPAVAFYDKLGFKRKAELDYTRTDKIPSYFYDILIKDAIKNF